MMEALSSWLVMADGSGSSFASSKNSAFSFSRRVLAAFFDFSFIACSHHTAGSVAAAVTADGYQSINQSL